MISLKYVRARVLVTGKVQGVFYRQTARDKALKFGLTGWVRNLPNGNVEIVLEGSEEKIKEMVEWCKIGPFNAVVNDVKIEIKEHKGEFDDFSILR